MILKHKHIYKTLLKSPNTPPTPIEVQRVLMGQPNPTSTFPQDVCPALLDIIRYTDGTGNSLQVGDRIYLDDQGLTPEFNLDTGAPYRTQLQGESPDSTAVAFNNEGYVVSIEFIC